MEDSTDVHIIRQLVPVILSMTSSADKPPILHLHWNQSFSNSFSVSADISGSHSLHLDLSLYDPLNLGLKETGKMNHVYCGWISSRSRASERLDLSQWVYTFFAFYVQKQ